MGKKAKVRMGRPPKRPEEQKSLLLQIRMTAQERQIIEDVAGDGMSTWARDVLLKAARRAKKNAPGD